jgi:hypothetical protein
MAGNPRLLIERWAPWVAAAVLVAGIAAFAATRLTGNGEAHPVAPPPQARAVAHTFVATAVARKDLARAWTITAPTLRGTMTLAEWKTGTIPVTPYPVAKAAAHWSTESSTGDTVVFRVRFLPPPASSTPAGDFDITLQHLDSRWLVAGWAPRSVVHPGG